MKFAPPSLFSAFAVTAIGDADLPDGVHLRLGLSPDLGPPLAPFVLWQMTLHPSATVTGGGPVAIPGGDVAVDTRRTVAVIAADDTGSPKTLVIGDAGGGEIARRSAGPWQVAAPVIQAARVDGGSATTQVGLFTVAAADFARFVNTRPDALLPLPIGGPCVWYAGGGTPSQGLDRVKRGAPRRFTPVDRPAGPLSPLAPTDELTRVQAKSEIDPRLDALLRTDPTMPPAKRTLTLTSPNPVNPAGPPSTVETDIWGMLLLQTADIGYARYAGLATKLDVTTMPPPPTVSAGRTIMPGFWIAGLFAMPPESLIWTMPSGVGGDPLVVLKVPLPVDAAEQQLIQGFRAVTPGLDAVIKRATDAGLQVRPMLTFCAAPVPADPPRAGTVTPGEAKWIAQASGPSTSFRQSFAFANQPLAATMAMAASFGGGAVAPRTGVVDNSGGRRRPLLVGRRADTGTVTASDTNIPVAPAPAAYRFFAGDLFGRYGGASTCAAAPPAVPPPPPPTPQTVVTRAVLAPSDPAPQSPGTLSVIVPVPSVDTLAAGARPIASVDWTFAGASGSIAAQPKTSFDLPLPKLLPLATGEWVLTVAFRDDKGTPSAPASRTVTVTDGRAPPPVKAGRGIVWTSRPGPAPEVEVNLRWKAAPGQLFRCYLASAASLGVAGATRAAIAAAVTPAQLANRGAFQLLSDPPIAAGPDGFAHLSATLPRALRDVSFVKVVALSPQGVEADFAASGAVPVAVPGDLPPPPPRVSGAVKPDGAGVMLTVAATGLHLVALQAAEPTLFATPPAADAKPPTARLRRATGPVNDPLYARPVGGAVPLVRQPDGAFAATVDDGGLTPFVRCT